MEQMRLMFFGLNHQTSYTESRYRLGHRPNLLIDGIKSTTAMRSVAVPSGHAVVDPTIEDSMHRLVITRQ